VTLTLNPEILVLSQIIAVLVLLIIVLIAIFDVRGVVREVLTLMLLISIIINYGIVYAVSKSGVSITIYPLFITEQYNAYGSFYPDLSQISLLLILIMWRRELLKILKTFKVPRKVITQLN